ncbi:MAG: CdaR family protein [Clostridium sp.]|nr:CdaR family protein [Clostridium sp.]
MGEGKNKKIAMIVCILLSFSLWLYITNVENPSKIRTITNVEVNILNIDYLEQKGLILEPNQKLTVDIKVEAPANQIYSINAEDFNVQVNLDEYALKVGTNNIPIEFISYPDGVTIKNNNSLQLKLKIKKLKTKEMKVTSMVNLNYEKGYFEKAIDISPKSVTISGAEDDVNEVDKVVLIGEENDINKSFSNKYKLMALDKNNKEVKWIKLSEEEGEMSVEVSSEKVVPIKIKTIGQLPKGLIIKDTILSVNNLSILGNNDIINAIQSIDTENIDLSLINKSTTVNVKLVIPNDIKIEKDIKDINVTFTIEEVSLKNKIINNVPINYIDKSDLYEYELPETVDITISGKDEDIEAVKSEDILVEASLKNIESEGSFEIEWSAKLKNNITVTIINQNGKINVISKLKK